ncbi:MAG: aminotransferase class I/II-fold pyridoxal phosphate-dependent enzyme [Polyangiales bacterium]
MTRTEQVRSGKGGRGIVEKCDIKENVPVVVSTFSKTLGGIGGILLGSEDVVDHVKHNARPFLFSAALPVPIVAAAATILTMLEENGEALVSELHEKAEYMRTSLAQVGFDLGESNTHIMPVMCRDEARTLFMHTALLDAGILMVPIMYPAVKNGEERLRVNVTRGHSRQDIDRAVEQLQIFGKRFGVLQAAG